MQVMATDGGPAVVLLGLACVLGAVVGRVASPPSRSTASAFGCAALFAGTVAAPFWLWAVQKMSAGDNDLGVYSFALVLGASLATLRTSRRMGPATPLPAKAALSRRLLRSAAYGAAGSVVVFANYAYVLVSAPQLPDTFRGYLVIGAAFWLCCCGLWLGLRKRHEHIWNIYEVTEGDDSEDEESQPTPTTRMLSPPRNP